MKISSPCLICNQNAILPGCLSCFLGLCSGNQNPPDRINEFSPLESKLPNNNSNTTTTNLENITTISRNPGVVAKLMGLDSIPDFNLVPNTTRNPDLIDRSKSTNLVNFWSEFNPIQGLNRRARSSSGFLRSSMSSVQGSHKNEVLNFNSREEGENKELRSKQRKFKMGNEEIRSNLKKFEMGNEELRLKGKIIDMGIEEQRQIKSEKCENKNREEPISEKKEKKQKEVYSQDHSNLNTTNEEQRKRIIDGLISREIGGCSSNGRGIEKKKKKEKNQYLLKKFEPKCNPGNSKPDSSFTDLDMLLPGLVSYLVTI